MSAVVVRKHIAAPPDQVFQRASDFAGAARIISGIKSVEMLTPGPVGRGTRFRETRLMFGREATEEMEVVEFDAPHRYVLGCENHGCRYRSELRFTAKSAGTNVEMSFEAQPLTLAAKVMALFTKPMMKSVAKHCDRDLDDLKQALER